MQQPYINLRYFSNELDLVVLRQGVRFVDRILMNGNSFKGITGPEYPSSCSVDLTRQCIGLSWNDVRQDIVSSTLGPDKQRRRKCQGAAWLTMYLSAVQEHRPKCGRPAPGTFTLSTRLFSR
ncbi:hypothetical protein MAP00_004940 [Monascus purpureus]|nr:hypothetical protein MAP00_004940 [Monascus purpureus]